MYRLAVELLRPFCLVSLGLLLATFLAWRRPSPGRWIAVAVLLGLLTLACSPITAYLAMASLEWRYPPDSQAAGADQAIVVLSGGMRVYDAAGRFAEPGSDTALRCIHAAALYHRGPPRPMIVSGGRVDPHAPGPTLARVMYDLLLQLGVRRADLIVEEESATTYENARCSQKLLRARGIGRIVLVTDACHMRRAESCFRALGLEVTAAACNYYAGHFRWTPGTFLPSPAAAGAVEYAVHEWLGLFWYWLHARV
jgi:uncharacterized SAM-binding protein YcdF (DUF218 family)